MTNNDIPKDKMDQIIELATRNKTWAAIERETEVPRRKAKRAYEQYELQELKEEVKKARVTIASEETRIHINNLVVLAEYIADNLEIPTIASLEKTTSEYIDSLLHHPIFHEPSEISGIQPSVYPKDKKATENKKLRRIHRQNKFLFKALKIHTEQQGQWRPMQNWMKARDDSRNRVEDIRLEARRIIERFIKLEDQTMQSKIESSTTVDKMTYRITEAIFEHITSHGLTGDLPSVTVNKLLKSKDNGLEFKIGRICKNTVNNLYRPEPSQYIQSLDTAIRTMKKSMAQIEEAFDGIILRPLLLNSRCQMCP